MQTVLVVLLLTVPVVYPEAEHNSRPNCTAVPYGDFFATFNPSQDYEITDPTFFQDNIARHRSYRPFINLLEPFLTSAGVFFSAKASEPYGQLVFGCPPTHDNDDARVPCSIIDVWDEVFKGLSGRRLVEYPNQTDQYVWFRVGVLRPDSRYSFCVDDLTLVEFTLTPTTTAKTDNHSLCGICAEERASDDGIEMYCTRSQILGALGRTKEIPKEPRNLNHRDEVTVSSTFWMGFGAVSVVIALAIMFVYLHR